jgi:3-dehydroquinate synthase
LGIDLNGLKNQIGVFSYPKGVFMVPAFLETLPSGQIRSGFAEVLKHALIRDKKHWDTVKKIDLKKSVDWEKIIAWSVNIKNDIVLQDPREKGLRKLLNFGHTVGHAVETLSLEHIALNDLMHGEAIAVGMIVELYLSKVLAGMPANEVEEVVEALVNLYQPEILREDFFDAYLQLMMQDKKNDKGAINFTLLKSIGNGEVNYTASKDQIIEALNYYNSVIARA